MKNFLLEELKKKSAEELESLRKTDKVVDMLKILTEESLKIYT
jgi:hypothetical protein